MTSKTKKMYKRQLKKAPEKKIVKFAKWIHKNSNVSQANAEVLLRNVLRTVGVI